MFSAHKSQFYLKVSYSLCNILCFNILCTFLEDFSSNLFQLITFLAYNLHFKHDSLMCHPNLHGFHSGKPIGHSLVKACQKYTDSFFFFLLLRNTLGIFCGWCKKSIFSFWKKSFLIYMNKTTCAVM